LDGLLWGNGPLGQRAVDLARSILHIQWDELVAFHRQAYGPRHAVCVISVPEGLERSLDLAVRSVANWSGGNVDVVLPLLRAEARVAVSRMPSDLVYLLLAVPTVPRGHPDADALNLLSVVLGGSTVSRLFREIREKRGLCYDISCRSMVAATTGALLIEAGVSPEGYEEALTAIGGELRRIGDDVEGAELERARTLLLSSLAMQSDRPETWAQRFCRDLLILQRPRPFREIAEALLRITIEELRVVAKRYLRMDELRVAATGMTVSRTRVERARMRLLDQ
jgi:predicted Zn-dependent peptidase